jgi:hypothetical protein
MRRMSPQIIWLRAPVTIGVTAKADFAVSWGYNADDNPADTEVTALYADGTKIWTIGDDNLLPGDWSWVMHPGTESQGQDSTMVAALGAANVPAYRGQIYGVFRNFPLDKFGFKLPGITAEIVGSGSEGPRKDSWNPADKHALAVLSNNNFTVSKYVPSDWDGDDLSDPDKGNYMAASGVRSRTYHKRGQYYFEVTADYLWKGAWYGFSGYTGVGAGIAAATAALARAAGNDAAGAGAAVPVPSQGLAGTVPLHRTSSPPLSVEGPPAWGAGETFGLHINMNAGYLRARNVSQNSDWTAPVYYIEPPKPHAFAPIALGDPLYAYANVVYGPTIFLITASDQQTVNFGAKPFKGDIPSGATAWNGTGGSEEFLGTLPLKDFISKISTYCGLVPTTDLDFVGIDDIIHGGIITRDTTFADFLSVLGRAYGFDYYESDVIRIVRRVVGSTYTIDKAIPPEDLLVETDRSIETVRHRDDSPTEIELSYVDATQQFRWNIQKARRILFPVRTTMSKRKDAFAIPIVTNAKDALTLAGRALYREATQNVEHHASTLPRHMAIEPSDILTITAADTAYTVKVTEVQLAADCRLTLSAVNLLTDEDMTFNADAGSPNLPYAGNIAKLEAEDGADRMQASQLTGTMWAYEGEDTAAFRLVSLALAATDGADGFTGSQAPPFTGSMAATDRPDGFVGAIDLTLVLDLDFTAM